MLRRYQMIFGAAILVALVVIGIVLLVAPVADITPMTTEIIFYAVAGVTILSIWGAYAVQERVPHALSEVRSREEALELVFLRNLLSAGILEVSALVALAGLLFTGDETLLLFLVPYLVGLVALFPSRSRMEERTGPL